MAPDSMASWRRPRQFHLARLFGSPIRLLSLTTIQVQIARFSLQMEVDRLKRDVDRLEDGLSHMRKVVGRE
jgi:hypothetical protein